MQQKIRVKIRGYDHRVVDKATDQILQTVLDTGAKVRGPVPLPNKTWKMAVHKSPHIDAKSKEHFGMTIHSRILDIVDPNPKTIETLTNMQLPAGVDLVVR